MTRCVFCDITDSERNHILRDSAYTILMMANQRKVPGQLLVIPKRHVERFSEINKAEWNEIFEVIADAEKRLVSYYRAGCEVAQRYKPYLKEDAFAVSHLHFHIMPRREDDILERTRVEEHKMHSAVTVQEVKELTDIFEIV